MQERGEGEEEGLEGKEGRRGRRTAERIGESSRIAFLIVDGGSRLATLNLVPGNRVYGERLVIHEGKEYRLWEPFRSKLAAALVKGLKDFGIEEGCRVLYLGVSTGTTSSHISDIVGEKGVLYGVEISARVAREFVERVATLRKNVIPIIADARQPNKYPFIHGRVDIVYCDIAQPDQTEIAITNCRRYLKEGGRLLLTIKSRSIDVIKKPKQVFKEEIEKLKGSGFEVKETINLEPYDKDHALVNALLFDSV